MKIPNGTVYIEWNDGKRDEIGNVQITGPNLNNQGKFYMALTIKPISRIRAAWNAFRLIYRSMRICAKNQKEKTMHE